MSLVVLFPVGKEASCDSYIDFCQANSPDPGSTWYPKNVTDRHGQRVSAYLGPDGNAGGGWPEPEGGPEARADGVLSTTFDRPIDPEEQ